MIVDWIVRIVLGILTAVFAIVPANSTEATLLEGQHSSGAWGILAQANRLMPVEEILAAIALAFGWQAVLLMWAAAQWVYEKVPFKSS